jgi:hypothetical protein
MTSQQFLKSVYAELQADGHCAAGYVEQDNGLDVYYEKYNYKTFSSCPFGKAITKAFNKLNRAKK